MNFFGVNLHLPKTFDECVVTLPALPDDLENRTLPHLFSRS